MTTYATRAAELRQEGVPASCRGVRGAGSVGAVQRACAGAAEGGQVSEPSESAARCVLCGKPREDWPCAASWDGDHRPLDADS